MTLVATEVKRELEPFEVRQVEMILDVITGEKSLPIPLAIPRHTTSMSMWEFHGDYSVEVAEEVAKASGWKVRSKNDDFKLMVFKPLFEVIKNH